MGDSTATHATSSTATSWILYPLDPLPNRWWTVPAWLVLGLARRDRADGARRGKPRQELRKKIKQLVRHPSHSQESACPRFHARHRQLVGPVREGGQRRNQGRHGRVHAAGLRFPRRVGDADGATSPEELIAAAHGVVLRDGAQRDRRPQGRRDRARRTSPARSRPTRATPASRSQTSKLTVVAEGLTGIDPATFPGRREGGGREVPRLECASRFAARSRSNASVK